MLLQLASLSLGYYFIVNPSAEICFSCSYLCYLLCPASTEIETKTLTLVCQLILGLFSFLASEVTCLKYLTNDYLAFSTVVFGTNPACNSIW